jgi:signal transduction histidine kinase
MSGQGQPGGPRTVLYIEDDPPSRLLVRRLLAAAGYAVLEAGDAHSGIARALEVRPALILLDVDLPDLDGYAVAGILRSFPSLAAVPIVAVTAYAVNRGDRERTLVAGCDGYISKPIDPDRFAAQVEEYLGGRREEVAPAERAVYLADLNERFVRRLLAQLESVRALCDQAMRRATCLQRIHEAMDDFTSDLGVPTLLRSLLPRLAEALEVDQLSVELSQPLDSVSARPGRFGPGALSIEEALGRIELKVPLEIGGRMIGFITAFYPASRPPVVEDEAMLRVVAHQVALAVENARIWEGERRQRVAGEAQERAKDQFLAVLAHELRAPLAPIASAAALLERGGHDPGVRRQVREVIERQVRRQARLLDDILDLSRLARQALELRPEPVDLRAIVGPVIEAVRPTLEERRQVLKLTAPPEPLTVLADATRVEQVLINLLTNASKYSPVGGEIVLTLAREGEWAVARVRDRGRGIAPEMLPRIFDLFVQAPPVPGESPSSGLGIGLALSRRLVELHGGTIEARSEGLGHGSEFTVRLPIMTPAAGSG